MNSTAPYSPASNPAENASGASFKRNALFAAGGAALLAVGLAAGLSLRSAPSTPAPVTPVAPVAQTTPAPATVAPTAPQAMLANDGAVPPAPQQPAVQAPVKQVPAPAPRPAHRVERVAQADPAPQATRTAAVCTRCGTIESVDSVKVKGSGSGVGAVAGGVVGGALGNQMGHGNGKAAMTILGALGGGFAGNEAEKHVKASTVYDVHVRMQDGSMRTVRQATAPTIGERVLVDGNTLRADQGGG